MPALSRRLVNSPFRSSTWNSTSTSQPISVQTDQADMFWLIEVSSRGLVKTRQCMNDSLPVVSVRSAALVSAVLDQMKTDS